MTSFSDQLAAVRKSQWEAQLDAFRTLGSRALASTEQIMALNLKASRQSVEQAAGVFRHLLEARDPRDLFTVGSAAQGQWHNLFSYSRELMGIAAGAQSFAAPLALLPAPSATLPVSPANAAEQAAIATAAASTVVSEIAAAANDTGAALAEAALDAATPATASVTEPAPAAPTELEAETAGETEEAAPAPEAQSAQAPEAQAAPAPDAEAIAAAEAAVDTALSDEVPGATANPVVQALHEVAPLPAGAAHPLASTVPLEAAGQVEAPPAGPAPVVKARLSRKK